jgi:hypothetical protein
MTTWQLDNSTFPDLLPMTGRSPGIHVSDVIARLKGYDNDDPTNAQLGRMQLGQALEWAIVERYIIDQVEISDITEIETDGIYGSPDGVIYADDDHNTFSPLSLNRITEIKLTWMRVPPIPADSSPDSSILFDEKFFAWRTQLMSSCHMYGTTLGRLIAAFVRANGECDWRDWSVDFDRSDLVKNWAMVASCAEVMQGEQSNG